jgi:hypothetical protein
MASSNIGRSQSNIYLDDPDFYHQHQNLHYLPSQYSVSTMNMPSMFTSSTLAPPSSSSTLKNASSMQQLRDSTMKPNNRTMNNKPEQQKMITDQSHSTLSIPDINEQQFMNERLMCIQQMMASGQNFASMFDEDPYFAQQIMSYMSSTNHYQQQQEDQDVIEIMDE